MKKMVEVVIRVPVDDEVPAKYVADIVRNQTHFLLGYFSLTDAGEIYYKEARTYVQESR
jgi:hypothetical protein